MLLRFNLRDNLKNNWLEELKQGLSYKNTSPLLSLKLKAFFFTVALLFLTFWPWPCLVPKSEKFSVL